MPVHHINVSTFLPTRQFVFKTLFSLLFYLACVFYLSESCFIAVELLPPTSSPESCTLLLACNREGKRAILFPMFVKRWSRKNQSTTYIRILSNTWKVCCTTSSETPISKSQYIHIFWCVQKSNKLLVSLLFPRWKRSLSTRNKDSVSARLRESCQRNRHLHRFRRTHGTTSSLIIVCVFTDYVVDKGHCRRFHSLRMTLFQQPSLH